MRNCWKTCVNWGNSRGKAISMVGRNLPTPLARGVAALSVLLWFGVGMAGRAIAYVA